MDDWPVVSRTVQWAPCTAAGVGNSSVRAAAVLIARVDERLLGGGGVVELALRLARRPAQLLALALLEGDGRLELRAPRRAGHGAELGLARPDGRL